MMFFFALSLVFGLVSGDISTEFDYSDGPKGCKSWSTSFPQCGGSLQSPININVADTVPKKYHNPLRSTNINVKPIEIEIDRTPHSADLTFYWACCAPHIYAGPLKGIYRFHRLHFHWSNSSEGSEHTINGKRFALEAHLVFYNVRYPTFQEARNHSHGLAVFAILYQGMKHVKRYDDVSRCFYPNTIALSDIISLASFPYASYAGSLTSPPCDETVTWIVMTQPLKISEKQFHIFHELLDPEGKPIETNAREIQAINDRRIYLST